MVITKSSTLRQCQPVSMPTTPGLRSMEMPSPSSHTEGENAQEEPKENIADYRTFLESCDFIKVNTQWREVQDRLEDDERCSKLDKTDRLEIFQEHIHGLEKEEEGKIRKEQLRQKERKHRDEFRRLMEDHRAAGILTAKTQWLDYCGKIKDHPAYLAMASNISGSPPKDLFEDVAEEMKKKYQEDQANIKNALKAGKFTVTSAWTLDNFKASIGEVYDLVPASKTNLKLVFEEELELAKVNKEKESKKRQRLANDCKNFLSSVKEIVASSKWEDFIPLLRDAEVYRAISDESFCREIFDEYVNHLQKKAKAKLVFEELHEQTREKKEKEAKKRKRLGDDFMDSLYSVKEIVASSKWKDCIPLLEDAQEYRAISDESFRHKIFDEYIAHLGEEVGGNECKQDEEKDRPASPPVAGGGNEDMGGDTTPQGGDRAPGRRGRSWRRGSQRDADTHRSVQAPEMDEGVATEIARLQSLLDARDVLISQLRADRALYRAERDSLVATVATKDTEIETLQAERESWSTESQRQTQDTSASDLLRAERDSLLATVTSRDADIVEQWTIIQSLQETISTLRGAAEVERLRSDRDTARAILQRAEVEVLRLQTEFSAWQHRHEGIRGELATVQSDRDALQRQMEQRDAEMLELQYSERELKTSLAEVERMRAEESETTEALRGDLERTQRELDQAQTELDQARGDADTLRRQVEQLRADSERLRGERDQLRASTGAEVGELVSALIRAQRELTRVQSRLQEEVAYYRGLYFQAVPEGQRASSFTRPSSSRGTRASQQTVRTVSSVRMGPPPPRPPLPLGGSQS